MKKKKAHIKKILKTAVLAGIAGLSLAAFVPAVQAESPVNEFAQRVHDEMNSNSPFMQEARRFVADARAAHASGMSYDDFYNAHHDDIATYPELAEDPAGTSGNTGEAMSYMANALSKGESDNNVLLWAALERTGEPVANNPFYSSLVGDIGSASTDYGSPAIANGRITPGDSSILGHLWVADGIDANNHKITGVADGEISPTSQDAVNGRQLYHVNRRIDHLRNRVNRIGAGAAALAALQPLPYSPDQKWSIATGYGHYQDANATALGAYYYPNENIMVSMGTAFGNGENMVNAGLSLRLGPSGEKTGNKVSSGEIEDLKKLVHEQGELIQKQGAHIEEQDQRMAALEKQNAELLEKLEQIVK